MPELCNQGISTMALARRIRRSLTRTRTMLEELEAEGWVEHGPEGWRLSGRGERTFGELLRGLWRLDRDEEAA